MRSADDKFFFNLNKIETFLLVDVLDDPYTSKLHENNSLHSQSHTDKIVRQMREIGLVEVREKDGLSKILHYTDLGNQWYDYVTEKYEAEELV